MLVLTGRSGQFDLPVYINKVVLHETLLYRRIENLFFWLEIESLEFFLARDRVCEYKLDSE